MTIQNQFSCELTPRVATDNDAALCIAVIMTGFFFYDDRNHGRIINADLQICTWLGTLSLYLSRITVVYRHTPLDQVPRYILVRVIYILLYLLYILYTAII